MERVNDAQVEQEDPAWFWRVKLASNISLVANLFLLAANFSVYLSTGSMALLSTSADSLLDIISQIIIAVAIRSNKNVDKKIWPVGKSRMEPVGLVVVSSFMFILAFLILLESIMRLASENHESVKFGTLSIVLVTSAIGIKSILYLLCASVAKHSNSMKILAEDHRNDVLSNAIALICCLTSTFVSTAWFADSLGGVIISIYICLRWIFLGKEQAVMLIGKVASPEFFDKLKSIASSHHAEFFEVDVIRAYHFGTKFFVEIEIVVSPHTGIILAHDSALALQKEIEKLEEVERAHVHVDYAHRDEEEHKQLFRERKKTGRHSMSHTTDAVEAV